MQHLLCQGWRKGLRKSKFKARLKKIPLCVNAVQSASSNYEKLNPGLKLTIKRWTVTGDKAILAINTAKKEKKAYPLITDNTKRIYLTIDIYGDILDKE